MKNKEKLYLGALKSIVVISFLILISFVASASDGQNVSNAAPNTGSNNISGTGPVTNTVASTINVGVYPYGIAVSPDGKKAYVTNGGSNTISIIDTVTNTVMATVNAESAPGGVAITPDGKKAYVANYNSSSISVIDTATSTVISTIIVGSNPYGIAVSPDGKKAYVTNGGSDTVSVIDTATDTVISTIFVGSNPWGVAVNPAGTNVYMASYNSSSVSIIDTATNNVIYTLPVASGPVGVAVNPTGINVYVTSYNSNSVSVIDTATNTVTDTITVGSGPLGIAVNPMGTTVYVTNYNGSSVSVIDTTTNTVTDTITVGTGPLGVAVNPMGTNVYVTSSGSNTVSAISTVRATPGTGTLGTGTLGTGTLGTGTPGTGTTENPEIYCLLRKPQYISDPCPCFQFYLAKTIGDATRAATDGVNCSVTALGAREGWEVDPTFDELLTWTGGDEAMAVVSPYFSDFYGCNACRSGTGNGTVTNGTAPESWFVFLANDAMFVDQESVLKSRRLCDISGWGLDCSKTVGASVQLIKVKGPFNSFEEAKKAYCEDIVSGTVHAIPLTSGSKAKFNFDGQEHWIETAPSC